MVPAFTADIEIRQARPDDASAIAAIWISGVHHSFGVPMPPDIDALAWFGERITRESESFGYWVADRDGVIFGWCSLQPCRNNPLSERRMGEISTYIAHEASQKGLARILIRFIINHAASVGITYVVGHARAGNTVILKLLDSMGWIQVGQMPPSDTPDFTGAEPLIYLARTITGPVFD